MTPNAFSRSSVRQLSAAFLFCAAASMACADVTVPAQTVGSGQTTAYIDPGTVSTTTTGSVQVQSGAKGLFIGGAGVHLYPGFFAQSGSLFLASQDMNLADLDSLADTDFDGLPDAWEMLHFHNLTTATGVGDTDGDGINNTAEYRAGTDPNLNESTATIDPAAVKVVVKTATGKFQKVLVDWSITSAP